MSHLMARFRFAALAAVVVQLIACGSGGDDTTPPPAPTPTLGVTAGTGALSVAAGASGTSTVTIARGGGFVGDVAIAVTGAPAGVTVSAAPATIAAGETTSTMTITTATTVAPGTVSLTVSAAGSGVATATTAFALTTTAAAATPTLALTAAPSTVAMTAGASGTSTATIARGGGFIGDVTLTASGAPTGLTTSFAPATMTGSATTSAVTFAAASGLAAGSYPVVITAAGTGVTNATSTVTVNVSAPIGGTGIALSYCAADAPVWLAVQDGNGAWSRVQPNVGTNTYNFTVASGRAGIATVDTVGAGFDVGVLYATTAELNGFGSGFNVLNACGGKTVTGSVSGVSATQLAIITLGYSSASAGSILGNTFTLRNVADGAQDLVATRTDAASFTTDRVIIRRALNVANNGSIPVLDFGSAEAFAPVNATVSVTGLAANDTASLASLFYGVRGSSFALIGSVSEYTSAMASRPIAALPAAQLQTNEIQQVSATVSRDNTASRNAGIFFRTPSTLAIALGPALGAPTVARTATVPYVRPRFQLAAQSEYNRYLSGQFTQASRNRAFTFSMSGAYAAGAWDVTMPDFSGVTGWQNSWGLIDGTPLSWDASAFGGQFYLLDALLTDGGAFRQAQRSSAVPF